MKRKFGISAAVALTVLMSGSLTSCRSGVPTQTPGVEQLGRYVLRQRGPETEVLLGYRFAAGSVADEWMILEVAMTAPAGISTTIDRDDIWVKAPDGTRIPMAAQTAFGRAFSELRKAINRANINRDPLDYFPPSRRPCSLGFFVEPGRGVSHDQVSFNNRRVCQGKVFFHLSGGMVPGQWVFGIDLEESTIRIPFLVEQ